MVRKLILIAAPLIGVALSVVALMSGVEVLTYFGTVGLIFGIIGTVGGIETAFTRSETYSGWVLDVDHFDPTKVDQSCYQGSIGPLGEVYPGPPIEPVVTLKIEDCPWEIGVMPDDPMREAAELLEEGDWVTVELALGPISQILRGPKVLSIYRAPNVVRDIRN